MMRYIILFAALLVAACSSSSDATPTAGAPQSTETSAPATTAQPDATDTDRPATAATTPQTGIEITLVYAMGAPPGGDAYVEAKVTPGAVCDLDYTTPSGTASEAEGLDEKTADANGDLRWDWRISPGTDPGRGDILVTCGDASKSVNITIG